ncbi:MAG: DEAD/DEAH box helicase [Candidatus Pacebacteria bacterium]|nr:DEAD/DEAH box helicase [Candidatus Paceibacterota bacterium]
MKNSKRNYSRGFRGQNSKPSNRYRPKKSGGRSKYRKKTASLNPALFIKRAVDIIETPYVSVNSFSDFPLGKIIKKNILKRGFDKPTAIQDQAILSISKGRDLVGIADTGTGKTAAFLLPLITKVSEDRNQKVLIITPTRELAAQIQDEFRLFSSGMSIFSTLCIGGVSLNMQRRELSRRSNFVIGTPGRIKDLESRRILNLGRYQNVVLDEVDRMLDMGFIHDVREIISFLPKNRQSLFFSATISKEIKIVMQNFLSDPITVSVKTGVTPQNVDQNIVRIRGKDKVDVLHDLLIKKEFSKVLVFGRTKWGVNKLEKNLVDRGFKAVAIHSNKSQRQRLRALKMLKNNQVQVLLATDVASRGIDIKDITHVINYDAPGTYNDYVHRIGRTGRAGKKGIALTFVD